MKLAIVILATCALAALSACTLTQQQQDSAVTVANLAIKKLDKKQSITTEERDIIRLGILAATNPKDRNADVLIANASGMVEILVKRGALTQSDADYFLLLLNGYQLARAIF